MGKKDEPGFRPADTPAARRRDEMAAKYPGPGREEMSRADVDVEVAWRNEQREGR